LRSLTAPADFRVRVKISSVNGPGTVRGPYRCPFGALARRL